MTPMTHKEWLEGADPRRMLDHLLLATNAVNATPGLLTRGEIVTTRKLWLFVAAVERIWGGDLFLEGVQVVEAIAEGRARPDSPSMTFPSLSLPLSSDAQTTARELVRFHDSGHDPLRWACLLQETFGDPWRPALWTPPSPRSGIGLEIRRIARSAHDDRREDGFLDEEILAVLSDALEEAGCTDREMMGHLRGPNVRRKYVCDGVGEHRHGGSVGGVIHGVLHETDPRELHHHHDEKCPRAEATLPHARGCWVVDRLLTGK